MSQPVVDAEGFRVFAKEMKRLDPLLAKALRQELKEVGGIVVESVRSSRARPYRTGRLRKSVKASATQKGVSVYSSLPYAPLFEFGGTIHPRAVPITFPRTEFVSGAAHKNSERVAERMAEITDGLADRYAGFHG